MRTPRWVTNPVVPKSRIESFSDAVFAIVATLLVIDLKVPHIDSADETAALVRGFREAIPQFGSFVLSFLIVVVSWVNHHQVFVNLRHCDRHLLWINGFLLLCVTFIPFPTATLGMYPANPAAIIFYAAVNSMLAVAFAVLRAYIISRPGIYKVDQVPGRHRQSLWRSAVAPLLYGIAVAVAFVRPAVSWIFFLAVPLYFAIPAANESSAD